MEFFTKLDLSAGSRHAVLACGATIAALLLLAGCGADTDESKANEGMIPAANVNKRAVPPAKQSPADAAANLTDAAVVQNQSPAEADAVARARLSLAKKLELVDGDAAEMVSVRAQQWTDGSLGCAKPGEMSAQVILDGHKVVLVHESLRYQVHVGPSSARVCERLGGLLMAPRRSINLGAIPALQQRAIADLAQRYGVPASSIQAERISSAFWPSSALGCPEPGVEYPQIQVNGYDLPLRVNGALVVYKTDGRRVVNCSDNPKSKAPVTF